MKEEPHSELGYVIASTYRQAVLLALTESVLCPTEIVEKTKYPQSHISKTLRELTSRSLVVCLNPNDRKGRLYSLTQDGRIVCAQLACRDRKQP